MNCLDDAEGDQDPMIMLHFSSLKCLSGCLKELKGL